MFTLIIPCSGQSSRFPNMRPKWMLTHPDGQLMLEKSVSSIDFNLFDRVIVTILNKHSVEYEADLWIRQIYGDNVEVCILDKSTKSQTETVYKTIEKMKVQGSFYIKDSDGHISADIKEGNFVAGVDVRNYQELSNISGKSFVLFNEQRVLTDIIEKSVSSNYISVGLYGFNDANQFVDKYIELSKSYVGEIYPSHIIASLIYDGCVFSYLEAYDYKDWGTIQDWRNDTEKKSCYFVDIDGVVFENKGRYGSKNWTGGDIPLKENIAKLKQIQSNGGQIIFCTARPEEFREITEKSLLKHGMQWHQVVMGCFHSSRVIINDFSPTNRYPSCKAVSIERDRDDLSKYL